MAMNIVNLNGRYSAPHSVGSVDRAASATPELALGSSQLPEASVTHHVDTISALRAAIADGSYKVDSQRLAGKIIDLESQLA